MNYRAIITALLFSSIFSAAYIHAAENTNDNLPGHDKDTLLYDGESNNFSAVSPAEGCNVRVTYVDGQVTGTHEDFNIVYTCTQPDTVPVTKDGDLKPGHKIPIGSNIKTGEKGRVELTCPDGSVIRVGPNSNFTLSDCDFEDTRSTFSTKFILGSIWAKVMHAAGTDVNFDVQTERAHTGVRGTVFSEDIRMDGSVLVTTLRVYEGSIEFKNENPKGSPEAQMKLQKDYEDGKITLDEYTKKGAEIGQEIVKSDPIYRINVEAGYESVIRGDQPPTTPVKFSDDTNAWYLDKNFMNR